MDNCPEGTFLRGVTGWWNTLNDWGPVFGRLVMHCTDGSSMTLSGEGE